MGSELMAFFESRILPFVSYAVSIYVAIIVVLFYFVIRETKAGRPVEKQLRRVFSVWGVGIAVLLVLHLFTEFGTSSLFMY